MPEGPLGGPRPLVRGVRKLQFNFRFNETPSRDEARTIEQSIPRERKATKILITPDTMNRVISITTDNQIVKEDLDQWEQNVQQQTDISLEEIVIIGVFE